MRLQLLDSLFELSGIHLQEACWTNPESSNPHYSFVEFEASSPVADVAALAHYKQRGVINVQEYEVLVPLAEAVHAYAPPSGDWHDAKAVLRDVAWQAVTQAAAQAMEKLLLLSFNSERWLQKLP